MKQFRSRASTLLPRSLNVSAVFYVDYIPFRLLTLFMKIVIYYRGVQEFND